MAVYYEKGAFYRAVTSSSFLLSSLPSFLFSFLSHPPSLLSLLVSFPPPSLPPSLLYLHPSYPLLLLTFTPSDSSGCRGQPSS